MKNEFGYDTSRWKSKDAAIRLGRAMFDEPRVLDTILWSGSDTPFWSTYLDHINPNDPMAALQWLRTMLELPLFDRYVEGDEIVIAYYRTDLDEEVISCARSYFQWGEGYYYRAPGKPDPHADHLG